MDYTPSWLRFFCFIQIIVHAYTIGAGVQEPQCLWVLVRLVVGFLHRYGVVTYILSNHWWQCGAGVYRSKRVGVHGAWVTGGHTVFTAHAYPDFKCNLIFYRDCHQGKYRTQNHQLVIFSCFYIYRFLFNKRGHPQNEANSPDIFIWKRVITTIPRTQKRPK